MDSNNNWVRSSRCHSSTCCVEVAVDEDRNILVRDSKNPSSPILRFTVKEWVDFIGGAKDGEFDLD